MQDCVDGTPACPASPASPATNSRYLHLGSSLSLSLSETVSCLAAMGRCQFEAGGKLYSHCIGILYHSDDVNIGLFLVEL